MKSSSTKKAMPPPAPKVRGRQGSVRPPRAERPPERLASNALRVIAFCDSYRKHFNAGRAAIDAGYSSTSARVMGCRMLKDPRVQDLLGRYALDAVALTNVRVQDILKAASEIAYLDPGECFEQVIDAKTGVVTIRLRDLTELPLEVRRCISSFKVIKKNLVAGDGFIDTIIEVKFWSKPAMVTLLAQHKGALTAKAEEVATQRQLEKMSDEELAAKLAEAQVKWDKHVAARQRLRLAVNNVDEEPK